MTDEKRRYIPIIHRTYQYRFLAFTVSYMIIVVFFMAAFVFVPEWMQMTDPKASFEVQSMAAEKILYGHTRMWPALIALISLIGLHSLRVFARFVGPLYQFTKAYGKIAEGDLSFRVKIRKGDYLVHERDDINAMIDSVSEKIDEARSATAELDWTLDRIENEIQAVGSAEAVKKRMAELRERAGKIGAALARFDLEEKEKPASPERASSAR
jgi:methyl-accepting chemotaxis protein